MTPSSWPPRYPTQSWTSTSVMASSNRPDDGRMAAIVPRNICLAVAAVVTTFTAPPSSKPARALAWPGEYRPERPASFDGELSKENVRTPVSATRSRIVGPRKPRSPVGAGIERPATASVQSVAGLRERAIRHQSTLATDQTVSTSGRTPVLSPTAIVLSRLSCSSLSVRGLIAVRSLTPPAATKETTRSPALLLTVAVGALSWPEDPTSTVMIVQVPGWTALNQPTSSAVVSP